MHLVISFASFVALASAQCTGNDAPQCAAWKNNGYCTNAGYSIDMRKQYCGVACGLCNTDGTQTAAGGGSSYGSCTDKNANCATWKTNGFCTNPAYSNSIRPTIVSAVLLRDVPSDRETTAASGSTTSAGGAPGGATTTAGGAGGATTTVTPAPGGKKLRTHGSYYGFIDK